MLDVSFIVPLYNCLELTRACLASLEETVRGVTYEILIVDDGSTDGTREFLSALGPPYRILLNEANLGYAASNNRAARCARAPILCLLNNDTVVTPNWLEPMMTLLQASEDVALVGNIHVSHRLGLVDHAGVFFDLDGHPENVYRGRKRPPVESSASATPSARPVGWLGGRRFLISADSTKPSRTATKMWTCASVCGWPATACLSAIRAGSIIGSAARPREGCGTGTTWSCS